MGSKPSHAAHATPAHPLFVRCLFPYPFAVFAAIGFEDFFPLNDGTTYGETGRLGSHPVVVLISWGDILIIVVGILGFVYESFGQLSKQHKEAQILNRGLADLAAACTTAEFLCTATAVFLGRRHSSSRT